MQPARTTNGLGSAILIEANPEQYKLKGSFRVSNVHREVWPHLVIFDGRLYLRDQHPLHCYDIVAKQ